MLVAYVTHVSFVLESGRRVATAQSAAAIHDSAGVDWPEDSVLIARFVRTGETIRQPSGDAKRHLTEPLRGRIELPPRRLSDWVEIGAVKEAMHHFNVHSQHFDPKGHAHDFGEPEGIFAKRAELPVLYRRGAMFRLQLQPGQSLDENGFHG